MRDGIISLNSQVPLFCQLHNCDFSLASATWWPSVYHHFPHSNVKNDVSSLNRPYLFHFSPTFSGGYSPLVPTLRLLEGIRVFDLQNPPKPIPQELVFMPLGTKRELLGMMGFLVGGDWNMTGWFSHILGKSPSQVTFIFFRGLQTTNQIGFFSDVTLKKLKIVFLFLM